MSSRVTRARSSIAATTWGELGSYGTSGLRRLTAGAPWFVAGALEGAAQPASNKASVATRAGIERMACSFTSGGGSDKRQSCPGTPGNRRIAADTDVHPAFIAV